MRPRGALSVGAVAALSMLMAGCGGSEEVKNVLAQKGSPVRVQVSAVQAENWPLVSESPGTVRAVTSSTLGSKLTGFVSEVTVQPGDRVRAGQVLVVIDSRDLEASLQQAQAAQQEAQSAIAEAENGVASAKAQLGLARVTFERMNELFEKKSVSNQEFDEAQARLRTAEATWQMAVSRRTQLDSRIAQSRLGVQSATVARSYAEIRAPFSGVVTERRVEPGQMATPGAPLLTVEQAGGYRLEAPVEESLLGSVRAGQVVPVAIDALGLTLNGKVDEIVPAIDPVSRSFVVKVRLPAAGNLRSGLFGRLQIARGSRMAVTVPEEAISSRGDICMVFVADGGVARTRMVTTGVRRDGRAEILSGVQEGDLLIHPRPSGLSDGIAVEARR